MNRKSRLVRIYLAILFCTIAERAIAQVKFEPPPLEGAIKMPWPLNGAGQCAGVINDLFSIRPINRPALSVQPAPSKSRLPHRELIQHSHRCSMPQSLHWLTLACECAGPEESWSKESYNRAMPAHCGASSGDKPNLRPPY